mmetsp:Transcript_30321/g.90476  ORF Transcript_30321/g.90476 Transcript_30321/m.90476 type:complete len:759 (+) Transcript_30321:306-2582(+)
MHGEARSEGELGPAAFGGGAMPLLGPAPCLGARDGHLRAGALGVRLKLANHGRRLALGAEDVDQRRRVGRRDDEHHADAAVEGAQKLLDGGARDARHPAKHGGRGPRRRVDRGADTRGEDARQVLGQATAGDVRERLDLARPRGGEATLDVELGRREERVGERRSRSEGRRRVPREAGPLDDAPHEREAVRVHARRAEADEHVSGSDLFEAGQDVSALHGADGEPGQVVVTGRVHARHLGRFAADERTAARCTAARDAAHDLAGALDVEGARGEVVEEEERLRALHDQVVDHHRHQVDADGPVLAGGLSDDQLSPDSVGARNEDRVLVPRRARVEEPTEPADRPHHAGAVGRLCERLDVVHERVARVDRHSRRGVGEGGGGGAVRGGSGRGDGGVAAGADVGDELGDGVAERGSLERLHARLEREGRVVRLDGALALHDRGAGVNLRLDVVDGAARLLGARGEDRLVHLQVHAAGEGRQERRVDVDAPLGPPLAKLRREDAHVSDQQHRLHAGSLECGGHRRVVRLAGPALHGHVQRADPVLPRPLEDRRVLLVRDDERDARALQRSRGEGAQHGLEGGAAGGAEDGDGDRLLARAARLDGEHLRDARVDQCRRPHVPPVEELALDRRHLGLGERLRLLQRLGDADDADGARAGGDERAALRVRVDGAQVGEVRPLQPRQVDDEALFGPVGVALGHGVLAARCEPAERQRHLREPLARGGRLARAEEVGRRVEQREHVEALRVAEARVVLDEVRAARG